MMNPTKRHLVSLAALALAAVACDPFPAAPGGSPRVVRVITQNQDTTGHSFSVENAAAAGAVVTDYAYLDDNIYIQFNKPMDGLSIQRFPDYNADGTPFSGWPAGPEFDQAAEQYTCYPAAGVVLTGFAAGTTVCYVPNSVTDGGYMVIDPADDLVYGNTYTVTGTVRDYQGNALSLDVSVSVDPRPRPAASGGYAMLIDWFDSGAETYTVEVAPDVAGAPGAWAVVEADTPNVDVCAASECQTLQVQLVPDTFYWYRLTEKTGGVPTVRKISEAPGHTGLPLLATLGTFTGTTIPPVIEPGTIVILWTRVLGADGYRIETAPNVDGTAPTTGWTELTLTITASGTTRSANHTLLTSGTRYWYRVTPTYLSGFVAATGRPVSRLAP